MYKFYKFYYCEWSPDITSGEKNVAFSIKFSYLYCYALIFLVVICILSRWSKFLGKLLTWQFWWLILHKFIFFHSKTLFSTVCKRLTWMEEQKKFLTVSIFTFICLLCEQTFLDMYTNSMSQKSLEIYHILKKRMMKRSV